jgi:hypothetical protein
MNEDDEDDVWDHKESLERAQSEYDALVAELDDREEELSQLKRRYEAAVRCFIAAETSARFEYGQAAPTRDEAELLIEEELNREHK